MDFNQAKLSCEKIKANIAKVIVGCDKTVELLIISIMCQGHTLLEDVPGTGKTMLAKALSKSIDVSFSRIQFTPDLLPGDVSGMNIYNRKSSEFEFVQGPIFSNIVLADEINRATPRTQSALLECMEEKQATIDGTTYQMMAPFLVIATQNPVETQGTFPLPEAQLDRFIVKTAMGYPSNENAIEILNIYIDANPIETLQSVVTSKEILEIQDKIKDVTVAADIRKYIVDIVEYTRKADDVLLGVSPRGSLALLKASQAKAILEGRDYVIPSDIKHVCAAVLKHRIVCKSSFGGKKDSAQKVVDLALGSVNVPTENID